MHKLQVEATVENLDRILEFVDARLEELNCPMKIQTQIDIAVEEIYVNIAHYAYHPGKGQAEICMETGETPFQVVIRFIDSGIPFDPLKKDDPDTTLSAEEREIGGLGIFMVKKSMDDVSYEYKDGRNILTIKKNLQ